MSTTDTMFESAPIAGQTGDAYQAALAALVTLCEDIADPETGDPNWDGIDRMTGHARVLGRFLRDEDYRPREKMTRADVHRNALRTLVDAVDEFDDLKDHDGGALGLNVWEAFDDAVRSAKRTSESYGPGDTTWAPEDDTNPVKVVPVPEPDPTAPPINGVRQGDMVAYEPMTSAGPREDPRRVLAGPDDRGYVRLSDPRDGGGLFGGYFVLAQDLGKRYIKVDESEGVA